MPAQNEPHVAHFSFVVGGAPASRDLQDRVVDCTVENSLHLPDMCTLRVHDAKFDVMDATTLREGKSLEVWASSGDNGQPEKIFHGEIASVEVDAAGHGVPTLLIRAYDRSHRLHRGRHSRTFVQVTDADIVQRIGQEAGFEVHADPSPQVHDWVMQTNQTNWEFLTERAARNGYRLYVQGERDLYFKNIQDGQGDNVDVEWGNNLRSFRVKTSATPQVDEVTVRGWDPRTKQAIIGRAQTPQGVAQIGEDGQGGQVASRAFGQSRMVVTDRPVQSQSEADALARSICDDIGSSFVEAEGLCYGNASVRPGVQVKVNNMGNRFSGGFQVTSTTHTYSPAEGYTTQFNVSGKRAPGVAGLMGDGGGGGGAAASGGGAISGRRAAGSNVIVIGVVTDNKDPDNQGRVKIKYPWLTEDHTSFWARIAVPASGKDRGFEFLPEINDEVLVGLEHGEISRPYVLGHLWNGPDNPPMPTGKAVQGGKVVRRRIKSRLGHKLTFFDTPDMKGGITLKTNLEHRVELNDLEERILVRSKKQHKVLIDDKNNKILIEDSSGNHVEIDSNSGSISLKASGNISIEAGGIVTIKGAQVAIN